MIDWSPDELKENLDKGQKVFLKLWKKGCGPCKLSTPAVERLEAAHGADLTFAQIETSEFPEMMDIADTDVLPVFFVFDETGMKGKLVGFKGLERLKSFVEESLKQ